MTERRKYSFADLHWLDNKLYVEGLDSGYSIWRDEDSYYIEKDNKFLGDSSVGPYRYGEAKDEAKKLCIGELNGG